MSSRRRFLSASLFALLLPALAAGCDRAGGAAPAAPKAAPPGKPGRKVLYYRNPMNPAITSPVFKKDDMGMDYIPVYADEVAPKPPAASPSASPATPPGFAPVPLGAEGLRLSGVATEPAVSGTLGHGVRTAGMVVPDEAHIHHVHTRISGWVETLRVNTTGQPVRAGETLLTLYSPELLATQEEYLRAKAAAARFAGSSLPEVRSGGADLVTAARQRLELFDVPKSFLDRLDRTGQAERAVPLLSPIGGYVTAKPVVDGQRVEPGMELFTIVDLREVWVEADFYTSEARSLAVGQPARLSLPYDPGFTRTGRISYIYPTLSPESRTLKVRIEMGNPGLALKPGMYVDVATDLAPRRGTLVPDSAVIDSGLRQVVFVETAPGTFTPREVRVGVRSDGKALLESGVAPGERVATRANFLLDSESRLRGMASGSGGK